MSTKNISVAGALFFTDGREQPEVHGYLIIAGQEYSIAGWKPDVPFGGEYKHDGYIGPSTRESDPA
jgi:hypothetical protein